VVRECRFIQGECAPVLLFVRPKKRHVGVGTVDEVHFARYQGTPLPSADGPPLLERQREKRMFPADPKGKETGNSVIFEVPKKGDSKAIRFVNTRAKAIDNAQ
jgi:hypothetical protein